MKFFVTCSNDFQRLNKIFNPGTKSTPLHVRIKSSQSSSPLFYIFQYGAPSSLLCTESYLNIFFFAPDMPCHTTFQSCFSFVARLSINYHRKLYASTQRRQIFGIRSKTRQNFSRSMISLRFLSSGRNHYCHPCTERNV